ncbi:MAG: ribonucleoside-diphosphate reductase subunit alpha [Verrucomicrobia bacterium]|nr:ribonucleoside-diphosphate reductase subunit alpha [Verrucomicrobiota bacterium]
MKTKELPAKTAPHRSADLSRAQVEGLTVVKRNGMLVPFRRDRILMAIEAAFRDTRKIARTEPLPQDVHDAVREVTDRVVEEAKVRGQRGACLTVEGIQDLVEVKLMEMGHHDIARDYIVYRDHHKALREDSPRNLKIERRDGQQVRFNPMKIAAAIEKAFRYTMKVEGPTPEEIITSVNLLTGKIVARAVADAKAEVPLSLERIQDEVERQLMAEGYFEVAKDAILYRVQRNAEREKAVSEPTPEAAKAKRKWRTFKMQLKLGGEAVISEQQLYRRIVKACEGLSSMVSADEICEHSITNFYDGIREEEIESSNIMAAKAKVEQEPAYSFVAARLLLDMLYRETMNVEAADKGLKERHTRYFREYLNNGIKLGRLDPRLLDFDLDQLAKAMDLSRDLNFNYLGLQTLYDRYFIHEEEKRLETPQIFWMRVAMGLCFNEGEQKNDRAIEFYNILSQFLYVCATPTLFNAGTTHPQLSSCYLLTVMDELDHIFKTIADNAQLSKWAGGIGDDWTNVRSTGARIKGTNGLSQGIIPFLKVANDTAVAVNQGGKRKGAMCAYLETWHLDVEDFLELRKNTGDERRRTHDMNTANWIPDLFMKRVISGGQWTLFNPADVPDLHDLYGTAFEARYCEYEAKVDRGEIKLFKRLEAVVLWRKMLSMLFETGHPWITFKDPSNIRSPQDHVGVVHSSNLCTEILLNTSRDETAVCNLGSVNLAKHTTKKGLNAELLQKTITTAMRMLDNVIDLNYYPTLEAKNGNMRHRPVGLGLMGYQDALYIQEISPASHEAVEFADESMEMISYYAILASTELAKERGCYESYKGSKWDRGILPIDSIALLAQERGAEFLEMDTKQRLDWSMVRSRIEKYGMRNSQTMAIAPTATISNIAGVTQSIEPTYKHLFVKSNLSGEFTVPNTYLVESLKKLGMWDAEMIDDLKYFDGSLMEIDRIPQWLRNLFLTAFEIEPEWYIDAASRRQKWIDMGQSLNLYISEPNGKKLDTMYKDAWRKGLKTTYYLRSLAATGIEKSTTDINKRGLQPRWMKSQSASARVQVQRDEKTAAPSCSLAEGCEACQ